MALAGAVLFTLAPSTASPASAAEPKTEAQQIIAIAKKQIGDPWVHGATGPRAFDCSGLVIYAFRKAGDSKVIGRGKYRSARALYRYFKAHGLADRKNPKPGDLVIWGRGSHVGIYIGHGKAISTLTSGVRIHRVHAVTARFTAYLHTGMWKTTSGASTASSASASASSGSHKADLRRTRGFLNLRTGAGVSHHRVALLRPHTRLVVTGTRQDAAGRVWLHVKAGTRTGWVARWLTTS